ncbi:hypothetical protein FRC08_003643 [Ceratobasidium sp. 394]|nr:hypothetical protein FRC08_003643 [Ceratobasidium sp. 394]KAG9089496.1 hypothetical protein FS749_001284 [Ceratobasidium sp. UAMH 11750]
MAQEPVLHLELRLAGFPQTILITVPRKVVQIDDESDLFDVSRLIAHLHTTIFPPCTFVAQRRCLMQIGDHPWFCLMNNYGGEWTATITARLELPSTQPIRLRLTPTPI